MTSVNSNIIEAVHTDIVRIAWAGDSNIDQSFNITCPFVPDIVEVSMCVTNTVGGNVYYLESDLLPTQPVCLAMHGNTYNPITTYYNQSRKTFQGSYKARVYLLADQSAENVMQIGLVCKFTRFRGQ